MFNFKKIKIQFKENAICTIQIDYLKGSPAANAPTNAKARTVSVHSIALGGAGSIMVPRVLGRN